MQSTGLFIYVILSRVIYEDIHHTMCENKISFMRICQSHYTFARFLFGTGAMTLS